MVFNLTKEQYFTCKGNPNIAILTMEGIIPIYIGPHFGDFNLVYANKKVKC